MACHYLLIPCLDCYKKLTFLCNSVRGDKKFICSDQSCFLLYFLKARHNDKEYPTEIPLEAHSQAQNAPQAIKSTGLGILHSQHYWEYSKSLSGIWW